MQETAERSLGVRRNWVGVMDATNDVAGRRMWMMDDGGFWREWLEKLDHLWSTGGRVTGVGEIIGGHELTY